MQLVRADFSTAEIMVTADEAPDRFSSQEVVDALEMSDHTATAVRDLIDRLRSEQVDARVIHLAARAVSRALSAMNQPELGQLLVQVQGQSVRTEMRRRAPWEWCESMMHHSEDTGEMYPHVTTQFSVDGPLEIVERFQVWLRGIMGRGSESRRIAAAPVYIPAAPVPDPTPEIRVDASRFNQSLLRASAAMTGLQAPRVGAIIDVNGVRSVVTSVTQGHDSVNIETRQVAAPDVIENPARQAILERARQRATRIAESTGLDFRALQETILRQVSESCSINAADIYPERVIDVQDENGQVISRMIPPNTTWESLEAQALGTAPVHEEPGVTAVEPENYLPGAEDAATS